MISPWLDEFEKGKKNNKQTNKLEDIYCPPLHYFSPQNSSFQQNNFSHLIINKESHTETIFYKKVLFYTKIPDFSLKIHL